MKYCSKCGNELLDDAVICPKCGCAVGDVVVTPANQVAETNNSGLKTAAKIFMILGCVIAGWMIIPLAWMIPMTVSYCGKVSRGEEISTGFKVCCLLFVSLIAGILMLCDEN